MAKKDKKKKGKKGKKKEQKKSSAPLPKVEKLELTNDHGPAVVKEIRDLVGAEGNDIPGSQFTFLTPFGTVFVKVNEKRTTWKVNDKSCATATFNNLFCGTETDKSLYEKYGVAPPKKRPETKDDKKKKKQDKAKSKSKTLPADEKGKKSKKKGDKNNFLLTEEQLKKKYPKGSLHGWLEFTQYGKKKQRKKMLLEFFPKKKYTGEEYVSDLKFVFGENMPAADIYYCFEWMDNN